MRYVIYGTGAVGGIIGGRLHLAGFPVTLIARGEHLRAIRENGLILDTAQGRHAIKAPATDSAAEVEWTDDTAVLLCVKSQQTAVALADLQSNAPVSTPIFTVQNGVANERAVLRVFASTYAVCVVLPGVHLEPGVVIERSSNTPAILDLGRYPSGVDAVATAVSAELESARLLSQPRPDIMAWKYRKLLMNLANGVDAVCAEGPPADELIGLAQAEGELVLAAAGVSVITRAQDLERRADHLVIRPDEEAPNRGSTWQSISRGVGSVEIDYLTGEIVLLGRLHGTPTPVNELIQRTVHEVVNAGGGTGSVDAGDLLAQLG